MGGNDQPLDWMKTEHDLEIMREAADRQVQSIANACNISEMWQGHQYQCATLKYSCTQHKKLTAVRYIWDTEGIVNALWSTIHHDGEVKFKLSERWPLPTAVSAKDLPEEQTQQYTVHRLHWIDCPPADSVDGCAPASILDT